MPSMLSRLRIGFDYHLSERVRDVGLRAFAVAILAFLVSPLFVVVPLSFNSEPFFTFPLAGISTQWYETLFRSDAWQGAARVSFVVALTVTALATTLGTLAAIGITITDFRLKPVVVGFFLSPLMVPHLIIGVGMYFVYAWMGLVYTIWGLILAHTALATPFVVLTVTATLANFNVNLIRAGAIHGAHPIVVFFRVVLPVILPGVVGGAVLAFVASFDELIVALLITGPEYKTIPRQMWSGAREEVSPVTTAAATVLIALSFMIMGFAEILRRRAIRARRVL